MCKHMDKSELDVLEALSSDQPRTEARVYGYFGVKVLNLILGPKTTLSDYIRFLEHQGEVHQQGDGFVLSEKGVLRRNQLRSIVRDRVVAPPR